MDRDRLIRFVDEVRAYRAQFRGGLTLFDRQVIEEMRKRQFFNTLRAANAMFHEHGFDDLFVGLDTLRRWQSLLEGRDLVQELPVLSKLGKSRVHHVGLMPFPSEMREL